MRSPVDPDQIEGQMSTEGVGMHLPSPRVLPKIISEVIGRFADVIFY